MRFEGIYWNKDASSTTTSPDNPFNAKACRHVLYRMLLLQQQPLVKGCATNPLGWQVTHYIRKLELLQLGNMVLCHETFLDGGDYADGKLHECAFSVQLLLPNTQARHGVQSASCHIYHRGEVRHQSTGKKVYHISALSSVHETRHQFVAL